jgi:hypothetical protein
MGIISQKAEDPMYIVFKTFSLRVQHGAGIALFIMFTVLGLSGCTAVVGAGAGIGVAAVQNGGSRVRRTISGWEGLS